MAELQPNGTDWKKADKAGRVVMPAVFKNRIVILRRISNTKYEVELGAVVPADEKWLHNNKTAIDSVNRGLEQAKAGQFAPNPPTIPDIDELE